MPAGLLTLRHSASFDCDMATPDQIDLARASAFRLGPITVEPALRQVTAARSETLEPRVMQVLVVLAMANGGIVSRDDLIRQCWEGRVVGDDSINRVIARLRKLADEHGDGAFRIETITKVGYRLIGPVVLTAPSQPPPIASEMPMVPYTLEPQNPTGDVQQRQVSALQWSVGGTALLAAIAGTIFWANRPPELADGAQLAVMAFATPGLPPGSAETLQNAMRSTAAPEAFRVVNGPASPGGYSLSGRLVRSEGGITAYPELRAPGNQLPIWTPQKNYSSNMSLTDIATDLVKISRCIVNGASETPQRKAPAAIAGWASYCEENMKVVYDEERQLASLRIATRAEPSFVLAQATLAIFVGRRAQSAQGADADVLRAEGLRAVAAAEKIDPDNALIYIAKSALTQATEFKRRDSLVARALQARPDGWGFELQHQAYFFDSVGRTREMVVARQRTLAIAPNNYTEKLALAVGLSMTGRYQEARAIFERDAATRTDRSKSDLFWLRGAINGQDWKTARRLLQVLPQDRVRTEMAPLIDALASGDKAAIATAGAVFEPIAKDPDLLSPYVAIALALGGRNEAAVSAAARLFAQIGPFSLYVVYSPAFSTARQTPEFEAFVRDIGLFDYWQTSGHLPDFCLAADASQLCADLKPRS